MGLLKSAINRLPGGQRLTNWFSYKRRSRKLRKIGDPEARFTHIFEKNKWRDGESRSGSGSSLATTVKIRQALPSLLAELRVGTLLDAPCGDLNWIQHVIRDSAVRYIGSDIVKQLIDDNESQFGNQSTRFVHADVTSDSLPDADLWLSRDCLIHLSFNDIEKARLNFVESNVTYWLTTTHRNIERNIDIPTGHCRMINLERPPFSFPPPLRYVEDDDTENTGKCLGLWSRDQFLAPRESSA